MKPLDDEVNIIADACRVLDRLPTEARKRALNFLWDRYVAHPIGATNPDEAKMESRDV